MASQSPLLKVGAFGVHLLKNPAGSFSFSGTVPKTIAPRFDTFEAGFNAFVEWFAVQPVSFQRVHVGNLRNDVFAAVLEFKSL